MIRVYAIVALLAASVAMAWHIKSQNESIGRLESEKTQLIRQLQDAARINADLSDEIVRLQERNQSTLDQIAQSEADKRRIQAELGKRNAELQDAINSQPEWSETAVPAPVADSVNRALDRLRNP